MPDLAQLRTFLAVAEYRNFTHAAAQLNYTQQTVSKSVAALEAELGVRLFERSTREVVLTAAGEALVNSGPAAVSAVEGAFRRATAVGSGLAGTVRVGVTPGVGTALHPRIAAAVAADAPDLQVLIREGRFAEAVQGLRRRDLDLVITRTGLVPSGLHNLELVPTPAVVIVAAGHPLSRRRHIAVRELDGRLLQLWNPADHPYSVEVLQCFADGGARVDVVVADVVGGGGPPTLTADRFVVRPAGWPTATDQTTLQLDPPGLSLPLRVVWASDDIAPVIRRVSAQLGETR